MGHRVCLPEQSVMPKEPCLDRLRAREEAAWDEMVDTYHPVLTALVCRLMGGWSEDVPDLVQDAFLRGYHSIGGFRGECPLGAWLCRIAANLCRDHQKNGWQRYARLLADDPHSDETVDQTAAILERLGLDAALAGLPERERVCVELRYVHELNCREIAAVVGRPERTVWSRIHAGLKRLRGALDAEEARVK